MEDSPSSRHRRGGIRKTQRGRSRRGFLYGLLFGQVLILTLVFGGRALLHHLRGRVEIHGPLSLEAMVFLGMFGGIVFTALLIFLILGLQGAGYVLGKRKVGPFRAIARGATRCFKATWAVGLTVGVIGGTAWFLVPQSERKPTIDYVEDQGTKAIEKTRTLLTGNEAENPPDDRR